MWSTNKCRLVVSWTHYEEWGLCRRHFQPLCRLHVAGKAYTDDLSSVQSHRHSPVAKSGKCHQDRCRRATNANGMSSAKVRREWFSRKKSFIINLFWWHVVETCLSNLDDLWSGKGGVRRLVVWKRRWKTTFVLVIETTCCR